MAFLLHYVNQYCLCNEELCYCKTHPQLYGSQPRKDCWKSVRKTSIPFIINADPPRETKARPSGMPPLLMNPQKGEGTRPVCREQSEQRVAACSVAAHVLASREEVRRGSAMQPPGHGEFAGHLGRCFKASSSRSKTAAESNALHSSIPTW